MLVERQTDELHRASLASGGKGALLTALAYRALRSQQAALSAAGSPLPRESAEGGTHPPCAKCKDRIGATQREKATCTGVRGRDVSANYFAPHPSLPLE